MNNAVTTRALLNPWGLRAVYALRHGALRFNELHRAINAPHAPAVVGIPKKLVRDGVVVREVVSLGPRAIIRYSLTAMGHGLAEVATPMVAWVGRHESEIQAARAESKLREIRDAAPVADAQT
jgi:DNA-binding HxlR family transcriptional regulator